MNLLFRTRMTAFIALLAPAALLASCVSAKHEPSSRPSSPGPASAAGNKAPGSPAREQNQKLGVSYVLPKGFTAPARPDVPGLAAVAFVLGEPDPSKLVTQFMLTKVQGPDDYAPGTSPDMDNRALVSSLVELARSGPGEKAVGETERSDWTTGPLPGSSALVTTQAAQSDSQHGRYVAFLGSADHRWSVDGTITNLPPGETLDSMKAILDTFAQSIQPL